jgi:hypothetical protein
MKSTEDADSLYRPIPLRQAIKPPSADITGRGTRIQKPNYFPTSASLHKRSSQGGTCILAAADLSLESPNSIECRIVRTKS